MWQHVRRQDGQQMVLVALMVPVLILFMGLALDGGMALADSRKVQAAADATATAAASVLEAGGLSAAQTVAHQYAEDNGYTTVRADYPWVGAYASDADRTHYIQVEITQQVRPTVVGAFWNGTFTVIGRATAGYIGGGGGGSAALIVLNSTTTTGFEICGSATLRVTTGSFHVNAKGPSALYMHDSGYIFTETAGTVDGNINIPAWMQNSSYVNPYPQVNTGKVLEDPLKNLDPPSVSGRPLIASSTYYVDYRGANLQPGIYDGGIDMGQGAQVTMQRGIYIMRGGNFNVHDGVTVTGNNVMIYFMKNSQGNYGTLRLAGGSKLYISAISAAANSAQDAPWAGILVYQDRSTYPTMTWGNDMYLGNPSHGAMTGILYFPGAKITFAGGSHTAAVNLIVDKLIMNNNAKVTTSGYDGEGWSNSSSTIVQVE